MFRLQTRNNRPTAIRKRQSTNKRIKKGVRQKTMRTREIIEEQVADPNDDVTIPELSLEILLDIRDLLIREAYRVEKK